MRQAEAVLDLKQWGNNLGVRLPMPHLHLNQKVLVAVEDGRVVITPVEEMAPTLEQRLALFDPAKHGGEAMAVEAVGTERR